MRLAGRGVIREGAWADVTIFDLEAIRDVATYERPTELATGVDWVLVNGTVVLADGAHTGATPGQVLYGPGCTAAGEPLSAW
jgi:N-acyl-D-aspartate/D-glutamate deacylase